MNEELIEEIKDLRKLAEKAKKLADDMEARIKSQAKQDGEWEINDKFYFIDIYSYNFPIKKGYIGTRENEYKFLNCFKTREQAEIARYLLIDIFNCLKRDFGKPDFEPMENCVFIAGSNGKRIAKELKLDEVKNETP